MEQPKLCIWIRCSNKWEGMAQVALLFCAYLKNPVVLTLDTVLVTRNATVHDEVVNGRAVSSDLKIPRERLPRIGSIPGWQLVCSGSFQTSFISGQRWWFVFCRLNKKTISTANNNCLFHGSTQNAFAAGYPSCVVGIWKFYRHSRITKIPGQGLQSLYFYQFSRISFVVRTFSRNVPVALLFMDFCSYAPPKNRVIIPRKIKRQSEYL